MRHTLKEWMTWLSGAPAGGAPPVRIERDLRLDFFRGLSLFFLPYVIPFVSGVLAWQGMLNLETGWVKAIDGKNEATYIRDYLKKNGFRID